MKIRCGNHGFGERVYHESIAEVRACSAGELAKVSAEKFFRGGGEAREDSPEYSEAFLRVAEQQHRQLGLGTLDLIRAARVTAPARITPAPKSAPRPTAPRPAPAPREEVTQDGIYLNGAGEIFKVVFNKASGSGRRLYAKKLSVWTPDGDVTTGILDLDPADAKESSFTWLYAPGAIRKLTPADKMSEADATRFGKLYGRCFKCHRALTKEESITRSMGDTCAGKQGF